MPGASPSGFLAVLVIPNAWECLVFAAPFLFVAAVRGLLGLTDWLVKCVFPTWEWEKQLGWLNLRAQRRADALWRWFGYFIYATLALALYGITWAASALQDVEEWSTADSVPQAMAKVTVLLICVGYWLVYLGCELLPKIRREHEQIELEKFRAENPDEADEDRELKSVSRLSNAQIAAWQKTKSAQPWLKPPR